jgi:hypothetical protein
MAFPVVTTYNQFPGGTKSALNITAAGIVKKDANNAALPGTLFSLLINAVGSAGVLTLNDTDTVAHAAAANQICTLTTAQLTSILAASGPRIELPWPCAIGIVVSVISGGIVIAAAYT